MLLCWTLVKINLQYNTYYLVYYFGILPVSGILSVDRTEDLLGKRLNSKSNFMTLIFVHQFL